METATQATRRLTVPAAEAILGQEFPVLDKGYVRLVDYMGSDKSIVDAARCSYGPGTKTLNDDIGLIKRLMRDRHTSCFEMVELKFHVKLPIFVARQWLRHRTANVNEMSGRYSILKDEFHLPAVEQIRQQSKKNKQGRDMPLAPEDQAWMQASFLLEQEEGYRHYERRLARGVARELARINLPLSTMTQMYWKIDLHNLLHFLKLRMAPDAQYEIRCYANVMAQMAKAVAPIAYAAWEEYVLHAVTLSRTQTQQVREALAVLPPEQASAVLKMFPGEVTA